MELDPAEARFRPRGLRRADGRLARIEPRGHHCHVGGSGELTLGSSIDGQRRTYGEQQDDPRRDRIIVLSGP